MNISIKSKSTQIDRFSQIPVESSLAESNMSQLYYASKSISLNSRNPYSPWNPLYEYLSYKSINSISEEIINQSNQILNILSEFNSFKEVDYFVNVTPDLEILFEWFFNNKKLSVYVSDEAIDYIKIWGTNIEEEMSDGVLTNPADIIKPWKWLIS